MGAVVIFDRLSTGELVATRSHLGRSVAAIVHPPLPFVSQPAIRWALAGDVDAATRQAGTCTSLTEALGQASHALGLELGFDVTGFEVPR